MERRFSESFAVAPFLWNAREYFSGTQGRHTSLPFKLDAVETSKTFVITFAVPPAFPLPFLQTREIHSKLRLRANVFTLHVKTTSKGPHLWSGWASKKARTARRLPPEAVFQGWGGRQCGNFGSRHLVEEVKSRDR